MTITRKFLFETSFDDTPLFEPAPPEPEPQPEPEPEPPEPSFSQIDLLRAHEDGYSDGFAAGRQAAEGAASARLATAVEAIERQLAELAERDKRQAAEREEQAVRIGLAIARKLLPATAQRHGLAEIEAMLTACVASMVHEPRLAVRVSEADLDAVKDCLEKVTTAHGFAGRTVIMADPDLGPGACRVEWSEGGVERDPRRLWQDIERIAARHLASPLGEPAADSIDEPSPETAGA